MRHAVHPLARAWITFASLLLQGRTPSLDPMGLGALPMMPAPLRRARGKGGKTPHRHVGTKAHARQAAKARRVRAHRRARRG